ncbi:MAG: helix-turn-helix domain-containing protein [Pseudomonadota bacterium]
MARKTYDTWAGCPLRFSAAALGDRWTFLILRDIIFKGHRRYRDFLNGEEGIATNVLANRLADLERHGIVERKPDPKHSARSLYFLTAKGRDLVPAMLELIVWAERHDPQTEVPKPFGDRARADPRGFADELVDDILKRDATYLD